MKYNIGDSAVLSNGRIGQVVNYEEFIDGSESYDVDVNGSIENMIIN